MRTPSGSSPIFASRLARFGLELAAEKTRLIEFGRFAAQRPRRAAVWASLRRSSSWASRTSARRTGTGGSCSSGSRSPEADARQAARGQGPSCMRRRHHAIPEQGRWLASVLRGHYDLLRRARQQRRDHRASTTRSPGTGAGAAAAAASAHDLPWTRCDASPTDGYPRPTHAPLAQRALRRQHPRQEPSALDAHAGICAGGRRQRRSLPRSRDPWARIPRTDHGLRDRDQGHASPEARSPRSPLGASRRRGRAIDAHSAHEGIARRPLALPTGCRSRGRQGGEGRGALLVVSHGERVDAR